MTTSLTVFSPVFGDLEFDGHEGEWSVDRGLDGSLRVVQGDHIRFYAAGTWQGYAITGEEDDA